MFGIKGPGVTANTTEMVNGSLVPTSASFRSFQSPADSVNGPGGYADFINNNPRYGAMRKADGMDAQLRELGKSGYATDSDYAQKIGNAASAIDGIVRKSSGATWSGQAGSPTDIKSALGYTGDASPPAPKGTAVASAAPASDFFSDLGIDPKGGSKTAAAGSSSTPATADAGGSSFFTDMGITPSDAVSAPAAVAGPSAVSAAAARGIVPGDPAVAFGRGVMDGVPIAGAYIRAGAERLGAGIRSLANNTKFSDELDNVRAYSGATAEANPGMTTAGNLAGAGAAYGGLAAVPGGAAALGMTGARILPQMAAGAMSNSAIGAADAGVRGENMLTGAGFGGVGGFFGPAVGKFAGAGVNRLMQAAQDYMPTGIPGVSRSAANMAGTVIGADGADATRAFLAQNGPLAMIADAGPSAMSITSSLATTPSAARTTVTNALTQRASGTVNRLTGDIDAAIGPASTPSRIEAGIQANREALGPAYDQAMQGARAVDTRTLANTLETSAADLRGPAASAVRDVRRMLDIPGTNPLDPSPRALLSTRNAIDGLLQNENNPQVIRQRTIARQSVDGELGNAVPGIKQVDGRYQELQRQSGALSEGGNMLDSGKTAVRPQELAETFPASANPEGQFVGPSAAPLRTREGVRAEIDRQVGTKANDLAALKSTLQGEGGWNTNKLTTMFGQEPTNMLLGSVGREAAFANTTNDVLRNSATAARQAGNKLLDGTVPGSLNLTGSTMAGMAVHAGKKALLDPIVRMLVENPSAPRNLELAHIITAQGANRDEILSALVRLNQRREGLGNTDNMLTGAIDPTVNLLLRGVSSTQLPGPYQ